MSVIANQLLERLAGLAAGRNLPAAPVSGTTPGEVDFADLLKKATSGEATSGLDINLDPSVNVSLSEDQRVRLGAALDLAKSRGFSRALVLLDGQALVVDVDRRAVTQRLDPAVATAVPDIDGVVNAPQGNLGDEIEQLLASTSGAQGASAGASNNASASRTSPSTRAPASAGAQPAAQSVTASARTAPDYPYTPALALLRSLDRPWARPGTPDAVDASARATA